jgi:hypothetical protein
VEFQENEKMGGLLAIQFCTIFEQVTTLLSSHKPSICASFFPINQKQITQNKQQKLKVSFRITDAYRAEHTSRSERGV